MPQALDGRALPGRSLQGTVNGQVVLLGSSLLMLERRVDAGALADGADRLEGQGRTLSWLQRENGQTTTLLGLLVFGDATKACVRNAVARLHNLGIGAVMLTGDNHGSADAVAPDLGIRQFRAEVLPIDKAAVAQQSRAAGKVAALVGDGINDVPALARVDVGIAMSTGTDVAMGVAGFTLMRGDSGLVADALDVSRRTYATRSAACSGPSLSTWWAPRWQRSAC